MNRKNNSPGGIARAKSLSKLRRKKIAAAGGRASMAKLTPRQRKAKARKAARARALKNGTGV